MKAWKIIAAIVAVLVTGFVVFLLTFDIGKYKGVIEQQAKAATGRDVKIGSIHMGLSLTPTVVLTDVTMANAPWGSRPEMIVLKKVDASAELLPLLHGAVNISKLDLQGADILLETNKQGQNNWEFENKSNADQSSGGSSAAVNISGITGSDLKVTMKDAKAGSELDAAVKSVALNLVGPMTDMNISHFTMNDASVEQHQGANDVHATIAKIALESGGPLKDLDFQKIDVSDVKLSGKNASGPVNAEVSKLTLTGDGALDLEAKYAGNDITAKGNVAGIKALKNGGGDVPMKLDLEGMGLKGSVDLVVNANQTPPMVKGSITIPEIDMAKFGGAPASGNAPSAAPAKGEPAKKEPMFSNEPLPWDSLNSVNADVKVSVGTIKLASGQTVTDVVLPIKLNHGQLAMNGASLDLAGGKISADVDANAAAKSFTVKGGVKGLTAEALAKAEKHGDLITGGPISASLDLRGSGASPHAIASTLAGSLLADMGESQINNKAMNMGGGASTLLQIVTTSNPLAKQEPYTVAKCLVVNFQIAGGVADTQNGLAFITDKVQGTGSGKVDLGQDRIDMIVKPKVSGAIGGQIGNLVSTLKVTGTIEDPSIGVDAASTAKAVAGLAAGVATGGAAGGLLGLNSSNGGGGGLFGAIGGALGGKKPQQGSQQTAQAAPAGDICAAARNWHK